MTFRTRWYNIVTAALFSVMTLGGALLLLIPDAILVYYLGVGLLVACLLWCTIRSARAGIVAHPTYLELRRTHRTRRFAWEHITGFGVVPGSSANGMPWYVVSMTTTAGEVWKAEEVRGLHADNPRLGEIAASLETIRRTLLDGGMQPAAPESDPERKGDTTAAFAVRLAALAAARAAGTGAGGSAAPVPDEVPRRPVPWIDRVLVRYRLQVALGTIVVAGLIVAAAFAFRATDKQDLLRALLVPGTVVYAFGLFQRLNAASLNESDPARRAGRRAWWQYYVATTPAAIGMVALLAGTPFPGIQALLAFGATATLLIMWLQAADGPDGRSRAGL